MKAECVVKHISFDRPEAKRDAVCFRAKAERERGDQAWCFALLLTFRTFSFEAKTERKWCMREYSVKTYRRSAPKGSQENLGRRRWKQTKRGLG